MKRFNFIYDKAGRFWDSTEHREISFCSAISHVLPIPEGAATFSIDVSEKRKRGAGWRRIELENSSDGLPDVWFDGNEYCLGYETAVFLQKTFSVFGEKTKSVWVKVLC